jgi:hypothetical protein
VLVAVKWQHDLDLLPLHHHLAPSSEVMPEHCLDHRS